MSHKITKEQCQKRITGVCPRCGGEITPMDTVDNAGDPTYWSGCIACCRFTEGISKRAFDIARSIVADGKRYFAEDVINEDQELRNELYNKTEETGYTVEQVLRRIEGEK